MTTVCRLPYSKVYSYINRDMICDSRSERMTRRNPDLHRASLQRLRASSWHSAACSTAGRDARRRPDGEQDSVPIARRQACSRRRTRATRQAAPAYALRREHALAQYAATGCLNATFYATAREQLDAVLELCDAGRAGVRRARRRSTARERGYMKDMPALLLAALLARRTRRCCERVFDRVIDDGEDAAQLRADRALGRGRPQVARLAAEAAGAALARRAHRRGSCSRASVGNAPSLADVVQDGAPEAGDAGARGALRLADRRDARRGGAAGARAAVRGVQGGRRARRAGRAVPDADGADARSTRVDADRAERARGR